MNRFFTCTALALALIVGAAFNQKAVAQPGVGVSITYQNFYDELSPYGEWIDYPDYGYVWRPSGIADFQPYSSNGYWVWSDDYEWMWVSNYSWGWAPFHYGRWFQDPYYGWMWVPGYEWGPAWVAWRDGGDYYGWAPLRPGIQLSINFSIGSYNPPIDYWCFAPRRYITSRSLYNYCAPRRQNITIINNTTIINNYGRRGDNRWVAGPRRAEAERYTGRIRSVRFREVNEPGRTRFRNNEVSVYRPQINRDNNRSFAPRQSERYDRNNANTRINDNRGNDRRNDRIMDNRNNNRIDRPVRDTRITDNRNSDRRNDRINDNRNNRIDRPVPDTRVSDNNGNDRRNDRITENRNNRFDRPDRNTRDTRTNDNRENVPDRVRTTPPREFGGGDRTERVRTPQPGNDRRMERQRVERAPSGGGQVREQRSFENRRVENRPAENRSREFRGGGQGNGGGRDNRGGGRRD
ncbi:MAG: hypothetical protein GXC78_18180 [Chitinophagaceae bacterium]|nr:hypothetical protein [Chitinophagaceae bacterium]